MELEFVPRIRKVTKRDLRNMDVVNRIYNVYYCESTGKYVGRIPCAHGDIFVVDSYAGEVADKIRELVSRETLDVKEPILFRVK